MKDMAENNVFISLVESIVMATDFINHRNKLACRKKKNMKNVLLRNPFLRNCFIKKKSTKVIKCSIQMLNILLT